MDEELDGLLGDQPGNTDTVNIENLIKNTGEKSIDIRNLLNAKTALPTEKYDGPFSHLSKPQLLGLSKQNNIYAQNAVRERKPFGDYVKEAADNTIFDSKIIEDDENGVPQKVDFNPSEWKDSPFASLGYGDFLYVKDKPGTMNQDRAGRAIDSYVRDDPFEKGINNFLKKFDDVQEYDFLVPTIDSETGKPIMKKVSGTYSDVIKSGYNPLNKYGVQDDSDNSVVSLLKSFSNTLGETDDIVISAAKYLQDIVKVPIEGGLGYLANKNVEINTGLDDIYEDTVKETERENFLSSKDVDDFGSANWLMSGTGSAFASLLQFGGIGRGVRAGVGVADGIAQSIGKKAFKSIIYDKVSSYGASGILGFGSGYNEALQNGLPEADALVYGTLVGGINSAIELSLGSKFDTFLTGGGSKQMAKDILKEMNGQVTEKSAQNFLKTKAAGFVEAASSRVRNMASEGTEEVLQDIVEQTAKLSYNALIADKDAEDYKGRFDIKQYNFLQTVSAGIFGAVAAAPFNSIGNKMAQYIIDGKGKQVGEMLDDQLANNKISKPQYDTLVKQKQEIETAININKNLFEGLSGDYAGQLKKEAVDLIMKKKALEEERYKIIEGLKDKPEDSEKAKEENEKLNKQVEEIASKLSNYSDPKFLQDKVNGYKDLRNKAEEARGNVFAMIASQANYKTDANEDESKTRVGTSTSEGFKLSALVRTTDEAAYLIKHHQSGGIDASLGPILSRDIRSMKLHNSPKVNTMENREALLGLGFTENELGLTPEEKQDALVSPEKYVNRTMTKGKLKILADQVTDEQLTSDPELARAKSDYTQYDKIKYLIKNRVALGITDAQLQSLDDKDFLGQYLTPKQYKALNKIYDIASPTNVILTKGTQPKARGAFHKESGTLFVDGLVGQLEHLLKTNASPSTVTKLQNELFHVLTHETAHAAFDRELDFSHAAWLRVTNNRELGLKSSVGDTINFEYFDRMLKLASLSYSVLKDTKNAKSLYFFSTIGVTYSSMDYAQRKTGSLQFVKEFFAEALSNEQFQAKLDSFDLNNEKNKDILAQFNYSNLAPVSRKDSLLSQVVQAVSSVFHKLSGVLNRTDRTVLTEAFALGSNLQFNKFIASKQELFSKTKSIADLSFSAYDAINLFDGESLDPDQMLATIYKRIDNAKIELKDDQRDQLLDNLQRFVKSDILSKDAGEYLNGTMIVVFFKNTNSFMLSWKSVNDAGETDQNRAFFSKFGKREYVNTDVLNYTSKTTLSKHHAFETFNSTFSGEEIENRKATINNLDRALREGALTAHLEYDQNKVWKFNNEDIQGQVTVVVKFQDGTSGIVGYAPDLTKVRLAHILNNGSTINVNLVKDGPGSEAYVKRDDSGNIIEAISTSSTASKVGFEKTRISPAVSFRYLPTSNVTSESIEAANQVDTITPDNTKLEPKVSVQELVYGRQILATGTFDRERFPEFSLYDESDSKKVRIEPGTTSDKIKYVQDGLERFIRRTMFFSKGKVFNDSDFYQASMEYASKAKVYLKGLFSVTESDNEGRLGFSTFEEFNNHTESVINAMSVEFRVKANQKRDGEDWSGLGGNPSGRISVAIKADIESLNYEYENQKHWLDFNDAKEILFAASSKARNYSEMVSQLNTMVTDKVYAGRQQAILLSLRNYLSKDRSAVTPQNEFFKSIENSYYSQFGSMVRLDGITFSPNDESAFLFFNGETSYLNQGVSDIAGSIVKKINDLRDSLPEGAKSSPDTFYKSLQQDMTNFAISRHIDKMVARGVSADVAAAQINSFLSNSNNSMSTLSYKIGQYKKKYSVKDGGKSINDFFNLNGFNADGIRFDKNRELYDNMVSAVDSYFAYFGVEIPESLFDLKSNDRNIQYLKERRAQLTAEGKSPAETLSAIKPELKNLPLNKYNMTSFKESKSKEFGEYPFLVLANQVADWLNNAVEDTAKGKKTDLKINELKTLVQVLTKQQGNYRSPEFYFNAEFNKEWALKTRSYLDDLVSNLSDTSSGLIGKYLKNDLYKNNRFLKSIKGANGQPIQFMVSGIRGTSNVDASKSYEAAGDLDYLYMNLAGFVHNSGSPYYYHMDDVPSDKPRNMAFRIGRVNSSELKGEIETIIEIENERVRIANDRFHWIKEDDGKESGAFEIANYRFKGTDGKKVITYTLKNEGDFADLIAGVHYSPVYKDGTKEQVTEDGKPVYQKGSIFSNSIRFYDGKTSNEIALAIENETNQSFTEFKEQGMDFPVSTQFIKELNQKNLDQFDRIAELTAEQKRVFGQWRINYIINRYHLNQVIMGDYGYYKPDQFSDLNKRHAGTSAPFSRGVFGKPKIKAVLLEDAGLDSPDGIKLNKTYKDENGNWKVSEDETDLSDNVNRTDAQGYVTEAFASQIQEAYGSFSGYEKVFKPVMFGVDESVIKYAQPLYLKLSLAIMPDVYDPKNAEYYQAYPDQLNFAKKLYDANTDIAVFNTGVKVGAHTVNKLDSNEFKTIEFDSHLFGLQNNPYHDPNSDENFLSGMVQQSKQLGDNGNYDSMMQIYHEIEGKLVDSQVNEFLQNKFNDYATVLETVKERLAKNDYSAPIADYINADVRVLDNPVTAKFSENLFNAAYKDAIALYPKDGEKLVNVSEYGFARPKISSNDFARRNELLTSIGITPDGVFSDLLWAGPRTPTQLTVPQLELFKVQHDNGLLTYDKDTKHILSNGDVKIYPAEVLVPPGGNYSIGDKIIATRIPTAKKSNSTPSEVVGFTNESQGNIIVMGKAGTAIHGFDFDVDGMFVWREFQKDFHKPVNDMFNIAFSVLTHPKNYNEITSPTTTDNIKRLADEISVHTAQGKKISYSKFSPERQLSLKKLNSVGKVMISVSAQASGIHSVLSQNNGSPLVSDDMITRGYLYNGELRQSYQDSYIDENGEKVLISEVYSEFINAATDNAKLQYLGRLNINTITAPVMFDMISRGIDMKYALYFINQPIIREYVSKTETQKAASFNGVTNSVKDALISKYEINIRKIPGNETYQFNERDSSGQTVSSSKAISHFVKNGSKFLTKRSDKVDLSFDQLSNSFTGGESESLITPEANQKNQLEKQLIVLDKFLFYKTLNSVTKNAGALIGLTSNYPKTFIELIDKHRKISTALGYTNKLGIPQIEIAELVHEHGMYNVHWNGMKALIDRYSRFKFYANPVLLTMHESLAGGKPVKLQQAVHDDFYTYILSQSNSSEYNLTTSSLTGTLIDPYHFVNESANYIANLKSTNPDNEFLRVLDIKISKGTQEQFDDKAIKPSQVNARLQYDPSGELLEKIKSDFASLSKYDQNVILGHLLYSQGFGLGGFNFSKVLPDDVVKYFDKVITDKENQFTNIADNIDFESEDINEDILNKSKISDFRVQVKMNHHELINQVSAEELIKAYTIDGSHFDLWRGGNIEKNAVYTGALKRVTRPDGGEDMSLMYKKKSAENNQMVKRLIKQGLVRISDSKGVQRIYQVSPKLIGTEVGGYRAAYIDLIQLNTRNFSNVKQYGSLFYNNKSNAYVENKTYAEIDRELNDSPEPLESVQAFELNRQVVGNPNDVSTEDIRLGKQTAITTPDDISINIGDTILLPGENELSLVRVKRAYNLGNIFTQIVTKENGNTELAAQKFIARWSELENKPAVDINTLLGQNQIQFEYEATLSKDGNIEHRESDHLTEPNENGLSEYNPINEFSNYDVRKSSGLYKAIARNVANKLKTIPTLVYSKDVESIFMDTLDSFHFDSLQKQIILDHLTHYAPEQTTSDEISDKLLELSTLPGHLGLENYNTADVWERDAQTPLEKLHDVGRNTFGPEWNGQILDNFDKHADEPIKSDESLVDYNGKPFTYYSLLEKMFAKYIKEEKAMIRIKEALTVPDPNTITTDTLQKYYTEIQQEMGVSKGLIFDKNRDFIQALGDKIGQRLTSKSVDIIHGKNNSTESFTQFDIKTWETNLLAITDFTERQAAMQEVGRSVSIAALKSDMEKLNTITYMENLMKNVVRAHFAHKPKSFSDKINVFKFTSLSQKVFDWMLEKDSDGNHTGRLVARYKPTEQKFREKAFEKFIDDQGNERFVLSNKFILRGIDISKLSSSERDRMIEITHRYDNFENFYERYQQFNDQEREQSGKDTTYLRNLWIKSKVRSTDSDEFIQIKKDARDHKGTSVGDLAEAKIKLYDYLYEKSNELLSEVGYELYPIERGMMPQTASDLQETWSRYGFAKAKEEFLKDTQDDIDKIESDSGLVFSLKGQVSFETSKKVPFRTITKKQNFSINVPAIFSHHFKTLIFKKHYDEVLPIMDAVQQHYRMQQEIGVHNYDNIINYITEYANQHIFQKKNDFNKTPASRIIKALGSIAVTQFLGFAPVSAFTNMFVGLTETAKHTLGDNGLGIGAEKYKRGLKRMLVGKRNGFNFTNVVSGDFVFNQKAIAIMNYYGIETFSSSEVQRLGNIVGEVQNLMLGLQKNSEVMVRGSAFFGEMTAEQWDSFNLDENGLLKVDAAKAPTLYDVAEWKNRIGSVQGKYDEETKRLYHGHALLQAAMLFKGWVIDYTRSRFGAAYFDQFGYQREGYLKTGIRLAPRLLELYKGKKLEDLTELEKQNLRKIKIDVAIKAALLLLSGAIGDDDEKENKYRNYIGRLNSQLFLLTSPEEVIKMVKNPFAGLYPLEQLSKVTDALMGLNFEQAGNAGFLLLPGRQVVNPVMELVSEDNE